MVGFGVAVAWIAISTASVKGLSAFARAAAMSDAEVELASSYASENLPTYEELRVLDTHTYLLCECP